MKKSFLKRVAAAAIAVPVALTQTVLFTSFAEEETAKTTTLGIDTFKAIIPDATRTEAVDQTSEIQLYAPEAYEHDYAYVQKSAWNEKLEVALDSLADGATRSIDAAEVLDAVASNNNVIKLIKAATNKEKTVATVTVNRDTVVVRSDFVIDVRAGIQEVADQNDVDMTFPDKGEYTVTLEITADTTNLNYKVMPISVKFLKTGATEASTLEETIAYIQDRFQEIQDYGYGECDKEEAEGNPDAPIMRDKLDNVFGKFASYIVNAQNYLENAKKPRERAYAADDVDSLYEMIRTDAVNSRFASKTIAFNGKEYSLESIPATIDEALEKNLYATGVKYFFKAINRANRTLAQKSYEIDVTDQEILDFLRSGYNFTLDGDSEDLIVEGDTRFYIPDEDFDKDVYVEFFESEIEAGNIEVPAGKVLVSADSVKVVEALGAANGDVSNRDRGVAVLADGDVYRIVWPIFEDEEIEDSSESTEESNTEESNTEESNTEESNTEESNTEETETESKPDASVDDFTIDVATDEEFFFSHDNVEFSPIELIDNYTVEEGKDVEVDIANFRFGITPETAIEDLSPMSVYEYYYLNATADGYKYDVAKPIYVFYDQNGDGTDVKPVKDKNGEQATAYVYIGVKGDSDLNGETNASDAANVLIYAAAKGAGETPKLYSDNDTIERFAYFLADTDTESENGYTEVTPLNASDAANILIYASMRGAMGDYYLDAQGNETTADAADAVPFSKVNWIDEVNEDNGVLSPDYPLYSQVIAVNNGLLPSVS